MEGILKKKYISSSRPAIRRKDLESVLQTMIEDKVDYGEFAKIFEKKLAKHTGCRSAIAVNSAASALFLILTALDVKEGDEIVLPSFAPRMYLDIISHKRCIPVLVDCEDYYYQPSYEEVRESISERTRAILLPYYFGYMYDPAPYLDLFPVIIEDITTVIGAEEADPRPGTLGRFAFAGFDSNQIITTGNGGAVFVNNRKDRDIILNCMKPNDLEVYSPGFPCYLPDLNAAMGISQLDSLKKRIATRQTIGQIYEHAVTKSRNTLIASSKEKRIYAAFPVSIKSGLKNAFEYFKKSRIEIKQPLEMPLHHILHMPREKFPNTESFFLKTACVPIYSTLLKSDVDLISKLLASMI
jgi:dTDP-4-amino-4,6-dideoxygalactose transaminase